MTSLGSDTPLTGHEIVLTHLGRSGSTVLVRMLKQHDRIAWLDEIFTLKQAEDPAGFDHTVPALQNMVSARVAAERARSPGLLVGHEIKLLNFLENPSATLEEYARATADPDRYVHVVLRRRNVLRRICSAMKAEQTRVYHLNHDETAPVKSTFRLKLDDLVDYDTGQRAGSFPELIDKALARETVMLNNIRRAGIRPLELVYEDDIEADPEIACRKVVTHLGLIPHRPHVTLKKTGGRLEDDLENYDELYSQVINSPHAWMLD